MRKFCFLFMMIVSVLWVTSKNVTVTGKVTNATTKATPRVPVFKKKQDGAGVRLFLK